MKDETERFFEKVRRGPGCWIWTGCLFKNGYGQFGLTGGERIRAHRWSYEHAKGPIPDGLQIDHICRNRACVNPAHLEAVTQSKNATRGVWRRKVLNILKKPTALTVGP